MSLAADLAQASTPEISRGRWRHLVLAVARQSVVECCARQFPRCATCFTHLAAPPAKLAALVLTWHPGVQAAKWAAHPRRAVAAVNATACRANILRVGADGSGKCLVRQGQGLRQD